MSIRVLPEYVCLHQAYDLMPEKVLREHWMP